MVLSRLLHRWPAFGYARPEFLGICTCFPLFYSSLSSITFLRLPLPLSITLPCLFPTYCIDRSNACWPLLIVIFSLGTMDELLQTSLSHNICDSKKDDKVFVRVRT